MLNLVTNAREALGPHGRIDVETGTLVIDERHPVSDGPQAIAPGPYVYVEVSDTGCGMDDQTRARIFDPFFSTKFAGRGLGLAVSLGIVRAHRGTIVVDRQAGQGTRMRVLLPAESGPLAVVGSEPPVPLGVVGPPETGQGTILVVDDD